MEISGISLQNLLKSFPHVHLAYEIVKNENPPSIDPTLQFSLHIPIGPKYFAWFSMQNGPVGVYLLELNRQKVICGCKFYKVSVPSQANKTLFYGTLLYGTWTATQQFVMEDIYYYKGQHISMCLEQDKWQILWTLLSTVFPSVNLEIPFHVPLINAPCPSLAHHHMFHHVQIRHLQQKASYVNYIMKPVHKIPTNNMAASQTTLNEKPMFKSFGKPQYKETTVFKLVWDPQGNDLYKLYAYGPNKSYLFYDYAMVQNTQTSFFLKQLFGQSKRNYCHKQNLDYLEESDDEEEKDNEKVPPFVLMQCRFHSRFKKWIPLAKVPNHCRVIHISQL